MKDLVYHIAKSLVDNPDDVSINEIEEDKNIIFELSVAKDDLGKVIGKRGRTARAIRTVLSVVASRENKISRLDIIE